MNIIDLEIYIIKFRDLHNPIYSKLKKSIQKLKSNL